MLSLERTRRRPISTIDRRRRRRPLPWLLTALVVAVALALLVAAVADVGRASRPYLRSIDRSYADQAGVIARRSNAAGTTLAQLVRQMPNLQRPQLQAGLDSLVSETDQISAGTALITPPDPNEQAAPLLEQAMADRAAGVSGIRGAVYGLLDISPAPVAGSPNATGRRSNGGAAVLTAGQAEARLVAAGAQLSRSDQLYAQARAALRRAAGHPDLPPSVWTRPGQWSAPSVATMVGALSASTTLGVQHRLVIVPNGVRISPAAVPSAAAAAGAPPGAAVIPPTRHLTVSVIVFNQGNVPESGVVVTASAAPGPGAPAGTAPGSARTTIDVEPGAAVAADLRPLPVETSRPYTLTVSISTSPGQTNPGGTRVTTSLWIAPAS